MLTTCFDTVHGIVSLSLQARFFTTFARWGPSLQPGHPEVLVNLDGDGANITATVENMYANRAKLARDMLTLTQRWNFSGFTLDWVRFASHPGLAPTHLCCCRSFRASGFRDPAWIGTSGTQR